MLFDDLPRTDASPAPYGEPHFSYLNRSARSDVGRVRELLTDWLSRYPDQGRPELVSRFRSNDDRHFSSAFFELYVHELLARLGCTVLVHPPSPNGGPKRPDFLVRDPHGQECYVEAIVASDLSSLEEAAEARTNHLFNVLNEVRSPTFWIGVDRKGSPARMVAKRDVVPKVEEFLAGLDPVECSRNLAAGGLAELPRLQLSLAGCELELYGLPKSPATRGEPSTNALGTHSEGAQIVDSRAALRNAILKKAKRYGNFDTPYLLAVDAISQHLDPIDEMQALFGREQFIISRSMKQDEEPVMQRIPDGAWTSARGPRNRIVCGVLIASSIMPWSVAARMPRLYKNPWSNTALPSVLDRLPRAQATGDRMAFVDGALAHEIFDLPNGWPFAQASA